MLLRTLIVITLIITSCAVQPTKSAKNSQYTLLSLTSLNSPWDKHYTDNTLFNLSMQNDSLHFTFTTEDTTLISRKQDKFHKGVAHSDRVEIFFATDTLLSTYFGLEIGADCRVFDFIGYYPDSINYNWQIPRKEFAPSCLSRNQTYTVSGSISINYLRSLNLITNNTIILGVFRADYTDQIDYKKVTWLTWQTPKSNKPQFHTPSAFKQISITTKKD